MIKFYMPYISWPFTFPLHYVICYYVFIFDWAEWQWFIQAKFLTQYGCIQHRWSCSEWKISIFRTQTENTISWLFYYWSVIIATGLAHTVYSTGGNLCHPASCNVLSHHNMYISYTKINESSATTSASESCQMSNVSGVYISRHLLNNTFS